jgi:hypothetical protein
MAEIRASRKPPQIYDPGQEAQRPQWRGKPTTVVEKRKRPATASRTKTEQVAKVARVVDNATTAPAATPSTGRPRSRWQEAVVSWAHVFLFGVA